jgi:serine/threonine protein phosphatase 1
MIHLDTGPAQWNSLLMSQVEYILAVGDIHGCYSKLQLLLSEHLPNLPPETKLVFLGDYVDRGPQTREVIERLILLKEERPDTMLLLGNHERMLLNAYEGRDVMLWEVNGGAETLASYNLEEHQVHKMPAGHIDFLRGLQLYHQSGDYIFVHAGLRPGIPLAEQDGHDLIWIRESFFLADPTWDKTVVFGHTPFPTPFRRAGMIGIDTGAVYNNLLTCLKLPEESFIHI